MAEKVIRETIALHFKKGCKNSWDNINDNSKINWSVFKSTKINKKSKIKVLQHVTLKSEKTSNLMPQLILKKTKKIKQTHKTVFHGDKSWGKKLKKFLSIHRNTPVSKFLYSKVASLKACRFHLIAIIFLTCNGRNYFEEGYKSCFISEWCLFIIFVSNFRPKNN